MNNSKIREGTIEDLREIQRLNQLLFIKEQKDYDSLYSGDWPFTEVGESYFKKELTELNRIVFVAEIETKIVGYLAASAKRDSKFINNALVAEIENTFILEEYRGRKIGSELIENFLKWCKKIKADRATVIASLHNIKAINFYKQHCFKEFEVGLKIDFKEN